MPNKDKIRFLFISQDTLNIVGGGRITLRKLISFLNKHLIIDIIDVVSLPHGNYSLEYYFGDNHGINYSNYFNPKIFNYLHLPKELLILIRELYFSLIFKYKIRKINPDLVFVQGITITVPVEFKSIYFVRDVYYGDNLVNLSKWKKKY
ncbi:MAG: hypothetical protein JXB44_06385 [Calditrichaceae bacterium]|nr:hypothetical protein [Calditrichaceae bacterium]RQV95574.1 MAG: hypothetical protein EH224_06855 [Calditrichota bacterium]